MGSLAWFKSSVVVSHLRCNPGSYCRLIFCEEVQSDYDSGVTLKKPFTDSTHIHIWGCFYAPPWWGHGLCSLPTTEFRVPQTIAIFTHATQSTHHQLVVLDRYAIIQRGSVKYPGSFSYLTTGYPVRVPYARPAEGKRQARASIRLSAAFTISTSTS